ncbi:MAG TPA: alpha/beta fold hydrolase [Actinomycetota bacterium]|nr:alpha/beta fold hydrolase [Actinomycetota bacterium]
MRQRRSWFVPALLAAAIIAVGLAPAAAAQEEEPGLLAVGRLLLDPCEDVEGAWCGGLRVPFDRAHPAAGTLRIAFEWYPAELDPAGTIVAVEGGPGYPSTGSRDYYLELFAPLQRTRNLLLVDNRGTGGSGLINCRPLQRWHLALGDEEYDRRVAACGDQLNTARRLPSGGFVHASDLSGTANAARDLAEVLAALETGPVDLYGDSYGSYFGQTFAARYPERLRSLTLDATWPVLGTDPFYVSTIETARIAFDLACRRSVACALAAPGSSMARIGALAERLRRAPVVGRTREPGSAPSTWKVDVAVLVALVNNAGSDAGVYRELDAAARAVLERRDAAPLLRLAAKSLYTDDGGPVREWSAGNYIAVTCADYPQAFDMRAPEAVRRAQYLAAVAALPDDVFAPFTVEEWTTSPVAEFDDCVRWPAPVRDDPPIPSSGAPPRGSPDPSGSRPPLVPRGLPALVLSGGLDTLTTWTDGELVAEQLGPSARWVKVENTIHVTALADPVGCASGLVRQFVRHPERLQTMDTSCARRMPEVRVVGDFPRRLTGATPATPRKGNQAGSAGLKLAAVGAAAVGDAIAQWWYLPRSRGHGLRGGWFTVDGDESVLFDLHKLRFVADTVVNGRATWNTGTGAVSARVGVKGPRGITATVRMRWDDLARHPRATLSGRTGSGARLAATLPAP